MWSFKEAYPVRKVLGTAAWHEPSFMGLNRTDLSKIFADMSTAESSEYTNEEVYKKDRQNQSKVPRKLRFWDSIHVVRISERSFSRMIS